MRALKIAFGLAILAGLGAVVGAIVIGNRSFDGLVVDSPYERGLAWDETRHALEESGLRLELEPTSFRTGLNQMGVRLEDAKGPVRNASIELLVTRPHTTEQDRRLTLEPDASGRYRAELSFEQPGAWELAFTIHRGEAAVEMRRRIEVRNAGGPAPSLGE